MTSKPISTISYNTEAFLVKVLKRLYNKHIIQAYTYIHHIGEDGDKDHFHLRIEPNKVLDPMDLTDLLKEPDPNNPIPLGVRPWRPSSEPDWFLYVLHNEEYLRLKYGGFEKGEKIPYEPSDICSSDGYDVDIAIVRAFQTLKHTSASIGKRLQEGEDPMNIVLEGENVYTVNNIVRLLTVNDYQKLAANYDNLFKAYAKLEKAVDKLGYYYVEDETEGPHLKKIKGD